MSAAKSPRTFCSLVIAAVAAVFVIAGCGGAGGKVVSGQTPPANAAPEAIEPQGGAGTEAATSEEAGGESEAEGTEEGGESAGGATAAAEGMIVFTSNCGVCHTLKAAGTNGNIGPNLDELMPSESIVETQVINGGGAMPAFGKEGILTSAEVKAVAAYVSSEAGK